MFKVSALGALDSRPASTLLIPQVKTAPAKIQNIMMNKS